MDKIYISHYHSPIGEITMAGNGEALIGLWFDGQKYFADTIDRDVEEQELQVLQRQTDGLPCIFKDRSRISHRPLLLVQKFRNSARKCGKFCCLFLMENPDLRGHCQTD